MVGPKGQSSSRFEWASPTTPSVAEWPFRWPVRPNAIPVRIVARCRANGPVVAAPAANGTASSRKAPLTTVPRGLSAGKGRAIGFVPLNATDFVEEPRFATGIGEFDRVVGGGLVPGSTVLIGGDPGIGKSTLLLQVVASLARAGGKCAYISGEEASDQIRMRAGRLGVADAEVGLAQATNVRDILASLDASTAPRVAVIDSIQTMFVDNLESAPGHRRPGAQQCSGTDPPGQAAPTSSCYWSAMSPKKARSRVRGCSSTWWTPCYISRANAATSFASCALSRTALGRATRLVSSRCRMLD